MGMMGKVTPLPRRKLPEVIEAFPYFRQSTLGTVDNCAMSARFDLEGRPFTNAAQARGIIFHRFAAKLLRTLWETGEVRVPTAEALEILYEASAQRDVPDEDVVVVNMRERRYLRICALALAKIEFDMRRLMDVERRLFAEITYPHEDGPVTRVITGMPDALLSDPPNGAIVLDWKTTPKAPPKWEEDSGARHPSEDHHGDQAHVSYQGYWQQRFYALLVMRNYPSVEHVTLREFYVMETPGNRVREATVTRAALEHIEREIADAVELLDRALVGGARSKLWSPQPGKHCGYCRTPSLCPIERDARIREGGIVSVKEARQVAAEYVLAGRVKEEHHEALKAWVDETGEPVPVRSAKGRYEIRWGTNSGGGRRFGLYVPSESDRGPDDVDLAAAFGEAADRRAAAK